MSILGKELENLKQEYNTLLIRYKNGLEYFEKNPAGIKKYGNELQKIMVNLDVKKHEIKFYCNYIMTEKEIEYGFEND